MPYKRAPDCTFAHPVPPFGTVSAFVRERVFAESVVPLKVRFAESVRSPFVVVNGTRVEVRYVLYRADAFVRAVVDAYGKVFAAVADEVKVEVAVIAPPKKEVPEWYELPWTEKVKAGEEEPMPTLPFVLMNKDDVPTRAFVPEKYATWPVVPVKSEEVAIESDCAVLLIVVRAPESPRPRVAEVVPTDWYAFAPP